MEQDAASPIFRRRFQQWLAAQRAAPRHSAAAAAAAAAPAAAEGAPDSGARRKMVSPPRLPGMLLPDAFYSQALGPVSGGNQWAVRRIKELKDSVYESGRPPINYVWNGWGVCNLVNVLAAQMHAEEHELEKWAADEAVAIREGFQASVLNRVDVLAGAGRGDLSNVSAPAVQLATMATTCQGLEMILKVVVLSEIDKMKTHINQQVGEEAVDSAVWHAIYQRLASESRGPRLNGMLAALEALLETVYRGDELDAKAWESRLRHVAEAVGPDDAPEHPAA